jgi:hypothetical protein
MTSQHNEWVAWVMFTIEQHVRRAMSLWAEGTDELPYNDRSNLIDSTDAGMSSM